MDDRILEIIGKKPELVDKFPRWMLPPSCLDELRKTKHAAVVEIAGRDSIAAALKVCENGRFEAVLPTIAYTGTQFGNWNIPFEKAAYLKKLLNVSGVKVFDPVVLGSPRIWWELNGRPLAGILKKYSFYSPCVGCHLYLHSIRIPLARKTGCKAIISGERESHDGKIKINQVGTALDAYTAFLRKYGVELLLPLRHFHSGADVQGIIGSGWPEGSAQMECVMSRNYFDANGSPGFPLSKVEEYLNEFAIPRAEELLSKYRPGRH